MATLDAQAIINYIATAEKKTPSRLPWGGLNGSGLSCALNRLWNAQRARFGDWQVIASSCCAKRSYWGALKTMPHRSAVVDPGSQRPD